MRYLSVFFAILALLTGLVHGYVNTWHSLRCHVLTSLQLDQGRLRKALEVFGYAALSLWRQEDHEIFDLVSAVEAAEGLFPYIPTKRCNVDHISGKGTTFYSWLEVSPTASMAEIGRAYRKKSMLLQCIFLLSFFALLHLRHCSA
jgi:hypothetical protein